jgi:hypothetical protein
LSRCDIAWGAGFSFKGVSYGEADALRKSASAMRGHLLLRL